MTPPRRALVLVDHGSRLPEAHAHLEGIAARIRERAPGLGVYVAHMELAEPSIDAAVDACAADGALEIVVHPFFLVPGRHLTEDIPELVEKAARRHPSVRVRITDPLGSSDAIPDWILLLLDAPS